MNLEYLGVWGCWKVTDLGWSKCVGPSRSIFPEHGFQACVSQNTDQVLGHGRAIHSAGIDRLRVDCRPLCACHVSSQIVLLRYIFTNTVGITSHACAIMKIVVSPGAVLCILLGIVGSSHAELQLSFYAKSCPQAERIIEDYVQKQIPNAPSLAAQLLRLHFHDCFVRGCDGSVLLNFTSSTKNQTEKVAVPNQTLRGFSFIDDVKKVVEAECPGVVSCADIVALVARDSVVATGGPYWNVPTGRRDGRISNASEALANIPPPTSNFSSLQTSFASKGLDLKDLVLLSGAHTIGVSHCPSFSSRLYNFTGVWGKQDPSLDSEYAASLKTKKCKSINDNTTIVEMDPGSSSKFDLSYFQLVLKKKGLFQSDAALTTSATTKSFINQLVQGSLKQFYAEFGLAMEKMGKIEVKTGSAGEIRKHCAAVNS